MGLHRIAQLQSVCVGYSIWEWVYSRDERKLIIPCGGALSDLLQIRNYELGVLFPLRSQQELDRVVVWERPPPPYGTNEPWVRLLIDILCFCFNSATDTRRICMFQ